MPVSECPKNSNYNWTLEMSIQKIAPYASNLIVHPLRLEPGSELKSSLMKFASHTPADGNNKIKTFDEHFEICSLVGTLSGSAGHLHIVLGRSDGTTVSGHVVGDCEIFTTAEIVIGECVDATFTRPHDERTGFDELQVERRQ